MSEKKQILRAIVSLAKDLGHTPSILEFTVHTKISKHSVFLFFPKWNQAVRAAGLKPNRLPVRPEDNELLKDWGEVVRKKRAIPSPWTYRLAGKYYSLTLAKRFGGWDSVPHAFRKFAKGKREWSDVLALLPAPDPNEKRGRPSQSLTSARFPGKNPPLRFRTNPQGCRLALQPSCGEVQHAPLKGRTAYGNPTNFLGLRYEPVNEQGVVLLFGMFAGELGYMIEAVQKGFPDCEALRQIAPDRWQRVRIEFEYESKNFHGHGHLASGCDVIVCWRHNWPACPKHLEVLELSRVVKSLASVRSLVWGLLHDLS